jgi:hypothetical protein
MLLFGLYQAANAEDVEAAVLDTRIISLDQKTLIKGYSVKSSDEKFIVPIAPKQFANKLTVKVSKVNNSVALPDGAKTITAFYEYDVRLKKVDQPITITFPLDDLNIGLAKEIYYLDEVNNVWLPAKTMINYAGSHISAKISLPRAKVVVIRRDAEELTAQAAIVLDKTSGKIIFEKNVDDVRPLASLTKLMTALVFLETRPDFEQIVTMQKSDFVGGATLWVKVGDKVKLKDLFYAMLVGSSNNATMAVARSTGMTMSDFVGKMNDKAKEMGLKGASFAEPTGLSEKNVATAKEMAMIAQAVFKDERVRAASTTQWYKVVSGKNSYWVKNTSFKLFQRDISIAGSKTGWTDEAGYNLVTQAQNKTHDVIALVMGAKIRMNYEEVYNLLKKYL